MKRILITILLVIGLASAGNLPKIAVIQHEKFYEISGAVSAFGKHGQVLLPGVSVYLFNQDRIIDSTRLDSAGGFAFKRAKQGIYDLAWVGNMYFPKKICQIVVDSTQQIYPSLELQILSERYPDSTWRPARYLYVTFKSVLTEDEIIRHLDWEYDLEILPFNNNSVLRPLLRYNGEKLYRATVILEDKDELELANRLILDPQVYQVAPDLLLPLPPPIKTNQKGARGR